MTEGKKKYYAMCNNTKHKPVGKWVSNLYDTQKPAENAARMHNQVNFPGHGAVVLTKNV